MRSTSSSGQSGGTGDSALGPRGMPGTTDVPRSGSGNDLVNARRGVPGILTDVMTELSDRRGRATRTRS